MRGKWRGRLGPEGGPGTKSGLGPRATGIHVWALNRRGSWSCLGLGSTFLRNNSIISVDNLNRQRNILLLKIKVNTS